MMRLTYVVEYISGFEDDGEVDIAQKFPID